MKDQKITIRLDQRLLDALNSEYFNKNFYTKYSFSEYLRRKLMKGKEK